MTIVKTMAQCDRSRKHGRVMILLLDNYDSFTFNLFHDLALLGADVKVVRNDAMSVDAMLSLQPRGVVISPGPGDPERAGASAPLAKAAAERKLPLLGVCLGHQSIGYAQDAQVVRAPAPVHGKTDQITHDGEGVFADLPSPMTATRYHSLVISRDRLPNSLTVCAETASGEIMAVRDEATNQHGVQFHPESVATPDGRRLLGNFLGLCGLAWNVDAADAPERSVA